MGDQDLLDFKADILRDIKLQKEMQRMFRRSFRINLLTLIAIGIVFTITSLYYVRKPTKKESALIEHLNQEKAYLQQSRLEILAIKTVLLKEDSVRREELQIMKEAYQLMINDQYIKNAKELRNSKKP